MAYNADAERKIEELVHKVDEIRAERGISEKRRASKIAAVEKKIREIKAQHGPRHISGSAKWGP